MALAGVLLLVAGPGAPGRVAAQVSPSAILEGLRASRSRAIDFHAARYPDTVYVGEQVTYQVAVLLNEVARTRLRRNPEFVPPELRGMLAYELGQPLRRSAEAGGAPYEAFVFQRALFPVAVGTLPIPAPSLSYAMPQSSSFFSRELRESLRAESLSVVVLPLPADGRPPAFDGAVGRFRVTARLDTDGLRVGVPVVVTVRVEGIGNLRLVPRPRLEVAWGAVVAGTERVTVDSAGPLVRGSKEFEWILTPAVPGNDSLPSVAYPYFDPQRGAYDEARTMPIPVAIAPGSLVVDTADGAAALEPWRSWDPAAGVPLAVRMDRWWLAGVVLILGAPLAAGGALVASRRTRRRAPMSRTARHLVVAGAPPANDAPQTPAGDARRRRRQFLEAVAARLGVSSDALGGRDDFGRVLRRHGVSRESAELAMALRDQLEREGFGPTHGRPAVGTAGASAEQAVTAVLARIDEEAVPIGGGPGGRRASVGRRGAASPALVCLVGAVAGALVVGQAPDASRSAGRAAAAASGAEANATVATVVADATRAYEAHQFQDAAAAMARAVAARPTDVGLLANWGTAAWAASDTVSAVVAWQRAARLQPWAADLQRNLARLPAGARSGLASVPLIPVAAALLVGMALWVAGWALAARCWWRARSFPAAGRAWPPASVLALIAAGAGGIAWGWWGRSRLDAGALAVVLRPETLHAAPSASAPPAGGVATGDVVRPDMVRDGWARVRHADGRRGWIPVTRVRVLLAATRSE